MNRLPDYGRRHMVNPEEDLRSGRQPPDRGGRGNEGEIERFRHGPQELPSTEVTEELVKLFAQVSGDHNPYHLDPEYARQSRYQAPIGHGILTVVLAMAELSRAVSSYVPAEVEVTRFTAPVRFGDRVRMVVLSAERDWALWLLQFVVTNQTGVDVLQGNVRLRPRSADDGPFSTLPTLGSSLEDIESEAVAWSRSVQPFPVRAAPSLRVGQEATYASSVSPERMKANVVLSKDSPWLAHLFALEAVAQASAELAPGFILVGAEASEGARPLQPGEAFHTKATVTRQGTLVHRPVDRIRIDMDVLDAQGNAVATGAVYKESEAPVGQPIVRAAPHPGVEFLVPADPRLLGALSRLSAPPFLTILDLGDADEDGASAAREAVARHLEEVAKQPSRKGYLFLRPHALRSPLAAQDLLEVVGRGGSVLDGVLLPDAQGRQDLELLDRILTGLEEAHGWERGRLKIEVMLQQWEVARRMADIMEASPRVVALINVLPGSLSTPELNLALAGAANGARVDLVDGTSRPDDDGRETALGALRAGMMGFHRKWAFNPVQLNAVLNPQLYLSDRDILRGGIPRDWAAAALAHSPERPTLWKPGHLAWISSPGSAKPMALEDLESYARQDKPLL